MACCLKTFLPLSGTPVMLPALCNHIVECNKKAWRYLNKFSLSGCMSFQLSLMRLNAIGLVFKAAGAWCLSLKFPWNFSCASSFMDCGLAAYCKGAYCVTALYFSCVKVHYALITVHAFQGHRSHSRFSVPSLIACLLGYNVNSSQLQVTLFDLLLTVEICFTVG